MDTSIIQIVRELLGLEEFSLIRRVVEAGIYVAPASLPAYSVVQQMGQDGEEHRGWLVERLARLDATPGPSTPDTGCADLHFQDLAQVLPRVVRDVERTVRAYEQAEAGVNGDPGTVDLVSRILIRHRTNLEKLREVAD